MATVTIVFPWVPGLASPGARIIKTDDDTVYFDSASCTEGSNALGIYTATFTNPTAGDYYIIPYSSSSPQDGVGVVFGVTNTVTTFYESTLTQQALTLSGDDITDIANTVVAGIQAIPGFTVEVVSPTDDSGAIEIRQGDAYLIANSRHIPIGLTGSLPSLESACSLHLIIGSTKFTYAGTVTVNSATSYTLKFELTGAQTAALPAGVFFYEAEVTYQGTSNKWTPSTGTFTIFSQAA